MSKRSAEYTLLGFYYQFDKNIFEILNQPDDSTVITVEGIEDIDISSSTEETVMQIKYQEKTRGTNSVLRKPISLMLKHFSENQALNLKYILYGYYSNHDELNDVFDLERLKPMFIYTENEQSRDFLSENSISDEIVEQFIKKFTLILGSSFLEHQNITFEKIKSEFSLSSNEEVETYYSNALKIINDLAIKRTISTRKITKKDFKAKIDLKNILFTQWFVTLKGKEKYLKHIYSKYFRNGLNTSNIERIFIINTTANSQEHLKEVIYEIERRFYKSTRRSINSGAPYVFVKNITQNELCEFKESIYSDNKIFIDGYCFHGSDFKCNEIRKESTFDNKISLKFINKQEYLDEILSDITSTKKLFEFYDKDTKPISGNEDFITKIQIENITDIPTIIRGK